MVPSGSSQFCLATALVLFELDHEGAGLLVSGAFLLFGVFSIILTLSPARMGETRLASLRRGSWW
jgi:hypothetical protein